ncbi:MAG: FMN-binding protein [Bacteroidaceae bacterium]|nr:FMN-binding protein [Bacteroidaceae bacterium]
MKYFITLILMLTIALNIQSGNNWSASTTKSNLNKVYLKALGFGGQKFTKKSTGVWKLNNGITIYSTDAYGSRIRGYAGPTPLFIAVNEKGKIVSIAAAQNIETEEYFSYVLESSLLKKWNGKTLKEAATFKPDAVTGATYSSTAVIRTVNATAKSLSEKK